MHKVSKETYIYAFEPGLKPVLTVDSGSEILFETYDCYKAQLPNRSKNEIHKLDGINPATGPVAISGAEPGDTLKVSIISIQLAEEGTMYIRPGVGVLKNCVAHPEVKKLKIVDNNVQLNEEFSFSIRPMIGVIGVSPAEGSISTISPGTHGGNMDTKEITEGAVLYLPVSVAGANLALGDLHAAMGDGETAVCGVEIAGVVRVKVEVIKGVQIRTPMLEANDHFYAIASAQTLDEAGQLAAESMFAFLKERLPSMADNDLVCLMGMYGDVKVSQMVNPLKTAKFAVSKEICNVPFS